MKNYYEFFQLPQAFSLDSAALEAAYCEVQGRVHPDKFVRASEVERRVAMQWSMYANEAHQVLKDPLKRALYLCEINGIPVQTESSEQVPTDFLMQQIEWRELLDQARITGTVASLEKLVEQVLATQQEQIHRFQEQYEAKHFSRLAQEVRQWMFVQKFYEELMDAFAGLEI